MFQHSLYLIAWAGQALMDDPE